MSLLGKMRAALTDKYNIVVDNENHIIGFTVTHKSRTHTVVMKVDEQDQQYSILMIYELELPKRMREEMAVMMGQANLRMACGGLEMDPAEGTCRYRHMIDVEGVTTTPDFLLDFVNAHVSIGIHAWPAIEAIKDGETTQVALSKAAF
jgi:hypothetical protein